MVLMDHVSYRVDSATADVQREMAGHVSHNLVPLHFAVSNNQLRSVGHISGSSGFPDLTASNNQMRQLEPKAGVLGFGENGVILTNLGLQTSSLPSKRKAEMEPTANNSIPQLSNKHVVQMGTSLNFSQSLQSAAANKKPVPMQSKLGSSNAQNLPALNKKLVRNESISSKSGIQRLQTPRSRTVQYETTSKKQAESSEAVRSKMREQLAAALALVSQNQNKTSNQNAEASCRNLILADSQHVGSDSSAVDTDKHKHQESSEALPSRESFSAGKYEEGQGLSGELLTSGGLGNATESSKVLLCSLPDEDVSFSDNFFVKDELLQGNGLSWALDPGMGATEAMEVQNSEKVHVAHDGAGGYTREQRRTSPDNLALEVEAELFKLFGGVNKKYKEKGRSLLFNLKDCNNPELRERVMCGEISPGRLCSMTAEELASKELSEWRLAKAEELAQMIVLPDTDFHRRRLVKKTHKGEYQVEMDEDDGNIVDVSGGASLLSQTLPISKEMASSPSSELESIKDKENIESQGNSSENQEVLGSLIIPSDGTDLMQGIMVDELKDADFLPPIISLDEFMESLNSEPPFENLRVNAAEKSTPASEKENSMAADGLANSDSASKDLGDTVSNKAYETVVKHTVDLAAKSSESPVVQKISSSKTEHIWEGTLQLNISSSVSMFGVFKSGEKTSTAEWSNSLEIKGRVRLDAFEKFIKELPMSRSRAVMVLNLDLKDKSSENERANLQEAVDSFVSDERLGFAEPAPGVELYLCPPNGKMVDMLNNYLSKDCTNILNSTDNGLIGMVVWRKAHASSIISPNSSSHHKHSMKRLQFTSRRQKDKDANVNINMTKAPVSYNRPVSNAEPQPDKPNDDDSDIPPGFGPPAARAVRDDDDDLPEFNFSGNVNPAIARSSSQILPQGSRMPSLNSAQVSPRPVEQIRQLIHKYGQTGSSGSNRTWLDNKRSSVGLGIEPWNDDDDDDIPEWRSHDRQQQPQPHPQSHSFHQSLQRQHFVPTVAHQQVNPPGVPFQSTANIASWSASAWQQGARWVLPPGNTGNQPSGGQYSKMPLLQDGSRSRGF